MTQSISSLTWQEQSDPAKPLANYTLNFVTDLVWQFQLASVYHFQPTNPKGVTVDNSQGAGTINIICAGFTVNILPFTREDIDLPDNPAQIKFTLLPSVPAIAAYSVPIVYWLVKPSGAQQNQFGVIQAVQAAIASNFLGSMQPIINSGMTENYSGLGANTLSGATAIYSNVEGWMLGPNATANYSLQQRVLAGSFPAPFALRIVRQVFTADTADMTFGTALTSFDSTQFLGQICTVSFDLVFGQTFSAFQNMTASLIGGTGNDEAIFKPFTGRVVLGSINIPAGFISGRVTFTTLVPVPANLTQVGLVFSSIPVGVSAGSDSYQVSRPQIDIGQTAQAYRSVPQIMERDRCMSFFESINLEAVPLYAFCNGVTINANQVAYVQDYTEKRVNPVASIAGNFNHVFSSTATIAGNTLSGQLMGRSRGTLIFGGFGGLIASPAVLQDIGGTSRIIVNARM